MHQRPAGALARRCACGRGAAPCTSRWRCSPPAAAAAAAMPMAWAFLSTRDSGCPSTSSMARKYSPSTCPKSKTWTMLPWLSPTEMRASWTNISTKEGFSAYSVQHPLDDHGLGDARRGRVARAVHDGHSPHAEALDQLVLPERDGRLVAQDGSTLAARRPSLFRGDGSASRIRPLRGSPGGRGRCAASWLAGRSLGPGGGMGKGCPAPLRAPP